MLADRMKRLGLTLPPGTAPTVALAGTPVQVDRLYPALNSALAERPGYRLVIVVPAGEVAVTSRRYSHEIVLPAPWRPSARLWRRRLGVEFVCGDATMLGTNRMAELGGGDPSPETIAALLPAATARPGPPSAGTFAIDRPARRRLGSLAELRTHLGAPRAILCLGNGPSSEGPGLEPYAEAALFRVNWIWRQRAWMDAPDMVFTADPDLVRLRRQPIVAFPTAAAGRSVLLCHMLRAHLPSAGYVFLDKLDPSPADFSQPVTPTNGALMVAVAAALHPDRLVIAGMDLYQHPSGRYPGDADCVDGYASAHSRETDLALIRSTLVDFRGETLILSENLRTALGD